MRYFPSASRQRTATAVLAVAVALGVAVPQALADDEDLDSQREQVEGQIDRAQEHLTETSRDAAHAARRLEAARAELTSARRDLSAVRSQLRSARARDARLQTELEQAQRRLASAREDLREGRAALAAQRLDVRDAVITTYTRGNPRLAVFSSILNSGSIEELIVRRTVDDMVVGRENQAYDALGEAEDRLERRRDVVQTAQEEVADRRQDAADNLALQEQLVGEAEDARQRVADLVADRRSTRDDAVAAREEDRRALQELEDREAQIRQEILEAARDNPGAEFNGNTDGLLAMPVAGAITSPYGYRTHPIYGYYSLHDGTDFGAACGAPLWASAAGTVVNTYYDEVYGNRLYLNVGTVNGANVTVVYNHLSGYAVSEGAQVGRGQTVGYVGTTGWSTGCHLHFTVLRNGEPVDPMGYL